MIFTPRSQYPTILTHRSQYPTILTCRSQYLLRIPQTHLKTYGDRAFSVVVPRLWNALPMDIKLSPSVSVFKNRLKMHLFRAT